MQNKNIKGIILAGGMATRLMPCTKVTNKHLLPIYNKPMIYYSLETLMAAGIKDIMIVSGTHHAGHFLELLGSGQEFGIKLSYAIQEKAGGIAQALSLCENFADQENIAVVLGDNIFTDKNIIKIGVLNFLDQEKGAKTFLKQVPDPERFGVAELENNKIINIQEKPQNPKTNYAVTGFYLFDNQVWNVIKSLKPSLRGELEISDVNNFYVEQNTMTYEIIENEWFDTGTFDSLLKASNFIAGQIR